MPRCLLSRSISCTHTLILRGQDTDANKQALTEPLREDKSTLTNYQHNTCTEADGDTGKQMANSLTSEF